MCCIAMCFTTFAPAIYAVDAVPKEVALKLIDGVDFYTQWGISVKESNANGDNYSCIYDSESNVVKFSCLDSETFEPSTWKTGNTVVFYAKVTGNGSLVCKTNYGSVNVSESDIPDYDHKIVVTLNGAVIRYGVVLTPSLAPKKYNVTFPSSDAYGITVGDTSVKGQTIQHFDELSFVVDWYDEATKPEVRVNGTLKADSTNDGAKYTYKIDNVSADTTIAIRSVAKTYTATLTNTDKIGFTYAGSASVKHGENFTFSVTPVAGYEAPSKVEAKVGGDSATVSKIGDNQYIIYGVTGEVEITVTAGTAITHSVTVFAG